MNETTTELTLFFSCIYDPYVRLTIYQYSYRYDLVSIAKLLEPATTSVQSCVCETFIILGMTFISLETDQN